MIVPLQSTGMGNRWTRMRWRVRQRPQCAEGVVRSVRRRAVAGWCDRVVQRPPRGRPGLGCCHRRRQGADLGAGDGGRPDGTEALVAGTTSVSRHFRAVMTRTTRWSSWLLPRHHAHPGAAAAQPGRTALPHGRGRAAPASARPGATAIVFQNEGRRGLLFLLLIDARPVRGGARHRRQHPQ